MEGGGDNADELDSRRVLGGNGDLQATDDVGPSSGGATSTLEAERTSAGVSQNVCLCVWGQLAMLEVYQCMFTFTKSLQSSTVVVFVYICQYTLSMS